jgi:hypothetical protein
MNETKRNAQQKSMLRKRAWIGHKDLIIEDQ